MVSATTEAKIFNRTSLIRLQREGKAERNVCVEANIWSSSLFMSHSMFVSALKIVLKHSHKQKKQKFKGPMLWEIQFTNVFLQKYGFIPCQGQKSIL